MGKIKSKQVKRASQELREAGIEFSSDFEKNKKILGKEMPSKKMRNKMAGFLARFERQKAKEAKALETK
jgi:ribosomal protein S17E